MKKRHFANSRPGSGIRGRGKARKSGKRQNPFPFEHNSMTRNTNPNVTDQPQGDNGTMAGPGVNC